MGWRIYLYNPVLINTPSSLGVGKKVLDFYLIAKQQLQ